MEKNFESLLFVMHSRAFLKGKSINLKSSKSLEFEEANPDVLRMQESFYENKQVYITHCSKSLCFMLNNIFLASMWEQEVFYCFIVCFEIIWNVDKELCEINAECQIFNSVQNRKLENAFQNRIFHYLSPGHHCWKSLFER